VTWCKAWQEVGGLPRSCHVVLPGLPAGGNVAVCVRGAHGVRMTNIDLGDWQTARRLVRAINGSLGIDAAAEHAMLVGCLRSWDSELADPDFLRATDRRFTEPLKQGGRPPVLH
jgi:hypothetical protein